MMGACQLLAGTLRRENNGTADYDEKRFTVVQRPYACEYVCAGDVVRKRFWLESLNRLLLMIV